VAGDENENIPGWSPFRQQPVCLGPAKSLGTQI